MCLMSSVHLSTLSYEHVYEYALGRLIPTQIPLHSTDTAVLYNTLFSRALYFRANSQITHSRIRVIREI